MVSIRDNVNSYPPLLWILRQPEFQSEQSYLIALVFQLWQLKGIKFYCSVHSLKLATPSKIGFAS